MVVELSSCLMVLDLKNDIIVVKTVNGLNPGVSVVCVVDKPDDQTTQIILVFSLCGSVSKILYSSLSWC